MLFTWTSQEMITSGPLLFGHCFWRISPMFLRQYHISHDMGLDQAHKMGSRSHPQIVVLFVLRIFIWGSRVLTHAFFCPKTGHALIQRVSLYYSLFNGHPFWGYAACPIFRHTHILFLLAKPCLFAGNTPFPWTIIVFRRQRLQVFPHQPWFSPCQQREAAASERRRGSNMVLLWPNGKCDLNPKNEDFKIERSKAILSVKSQ